MDQRERASDLHIARGREPAFAVRQQALREATQRLHKDEFGEPAKTVAANPSEVANDSKDAGKSPNARVVFGEQHIRVYGDVGINTGYYTFSNVREGKPVSTSARYTMVFRSVDGVWLLVAHHSSRIP